MAGVASRALKRPRIVVENRARVEWEWQAILDVDGLEGVEVRKLAQKVRYHAEVKRVKIPIVADGMVGEIGAMIFLGI